jgi:ABC-type bacteriocin/lantibiotic exporter with double-glycine peptidase domain
MLSGMETLKAMGLEQRAAEKWSHIFVDGLNISIKQGRLEAVFAGLLNAIGTATALAFLFYGGFLVLRGALSLGMMMAFSALAAGFLGPLTNLVNSAMQLQMIEVYLERLNDVMEAPTEQDYAHPKISEPLRGSIALEHVSFRYGGHAEMVLEDICIRLDPGIRIALVGRTGCGKSTLARLVAGLYAPNSGRVLFDDKDLKDLDIRSVRNQLGIVTQDIQLFGGSIRWNIALTDQHMTLERVVHAAKIAGVHDEIIAMPMGYETALTDRGMSLSGGQRQRLAIARAVAKGPRLLILDEATSHLDAATEEQVVRNLSSLNCTQVIIAHRFSTIRKADLIVVLESGKIAEQGTHEDLLRKGCMYAELVAAQRDCSTAVSQDVS